ncbi:MAG: AtpZ/AtpI family protein [Deferribacteres bacterium]|nr:AtpZ/AtpI family protein [candidate division KSB1 bacterium]MCB9502976.1 AtpZ/AtpI family protein [Deferribacteres bacterium]
MSGPIQYTDLGLRFAFSILIGSGIGYWLDQKFSFFPLFMIVGVFYGFASGFIALYRAIYPPQAKSNIPDKEKEDD